MDTPKPDAVEKIANLAKDAQGFTITSVSANAAGLPSSIPIAFDHRSLNGRGLVGLRDEFEKWRIYPERRIGTAQVLTLKSFIDLVNRHKSSDSVIFASTNWPNPSLTAVIDYHDMVNDPDASNSDVPKSASAPLPRFCSHRVSYPFPVTDEFKAWTGHDGEAMTQHEFAEFIEDRMPELAQATVAEEGDIDRLFRTKVANPAEMLALSRGLEVNVTGKVKNNVRLSSGEGEIVFVEEHLDGTGAKIVVPGMFMICLPVFIDGEPVRLPVRLRYRVGGGSVSWFYQLYRWKELVRERIVADLDTAATETALPAYEGSPESSR